MDVTQSSLRSDEHQTQSFNARTEGLQSDPRHGTITVNEVGKTSLDGVYAQVETSRLAQQQSSAQSVRAERAAKAMHEYLTNKK